jgi:hypothetical protein
LEVRMINVVNTGRSTHHIISPFSCTVSIAEVKPMMDTVHSFVM